MIAKLTNGTLIPLHWDDRYYVANCPECGEEVSASTASDVAEILDIHCQYRIGRHARVRSAPSGALCL